MDDPNQRGGQVERAGELFALSIMAPASVSCGKLYAVFLQVFKEEKVRHFKPNSSATLHIPLIASVIGSPGSIFSRSATFSIIVLSTPEVIRLVLLQASVVDDHWLSHKLPVFLYSPYIFCHQTCMKITKFFKHFEPKLGIWQYNLSHKQR
jgi:hypothetical protein